MKGLRAMWKALPSLGALALLLLAGGAVRAADGALVIYPSVWAAYQEYDKMLRPGAFAVARDGSIYGYSYCEVRCTFNTSKKVALKSCAQGGGVDCVIFAVQRDIKVAYRVLDLGFAGRCPIGPAPRVAIVADIAAPRYDFSLDIAALTAFERIGHARAGAVDFELLGLTVHEYDLAGVESPPAEIHDAGGTTCAGLAAAELPMRMTATVYVAREFVPGTCMHQVVLDHENRHQETARRLFTAFAADATRYLAADLEERPFVQISTPGVAEAAAKARVMAAIDAAYPAFVESYEREQREIDTTSEYARIANACAAVQQYMD